MLDPAAAKTYTWTQEHFLDVITGGKKPIVSNTRLIEAFRELDRSDFIDQAGEPYGDSHDEIGFGQVVESPILQAQLLQELDLKQGQKVLELGTGSGFSLALIAHVVGETGSVFSLERNKSLADKATKNLAKYTQLKNYELVYRDGGDGLEARAPFARIYISFPFKEIPEQILRQLEVGGKAIMPLSNQDIKLVERKSELDFTQKLIAVSQLPAQAYGVV